MAIQTATNPQTGERVALIDGQWQPFTQSATNAQGQKAFLVGGQWIVEPTFTPPPPSKERTWGEAFKDIGAGAVSGAGALVQLPGQLYGLATGDMSETGALGLGKDIQKYGEEMKSAGLKAREQQRAEKIAEASKKGELSAFGAALGETLKDPGLLLNFLAEQAPQLAIPFGAGKLGAGAAKLAGAGAKTAGTVGTGAAVGAGSVAQGADIGAGTYEAIYNELISKGVDPDQAKANTINLARSAGAAGGVISVLANMLPGSRQLEKIAAGVPGKGGKIATAGKTILGEIPSENIEEVGGKLAQNIAMQQVKPEQRLTEGLGETAAMATIGAAGMGTAAGALSRKAPEPPPPPEAEKKPEEVEVPKAPPREEPTITPPVSLTGRTGSQLLQDQIRGEQNVGLLDAARVRGEEQAIVREQERQAKEKEQARLDQEERDRQAAMLATQERARGMGLEGNAAANAQLLAEGRRRAEEADKQRAKEEAQRVKDLEAQKEAELKKIESTVYSADPLINSRRKQDALAEWDAKWNEKAAEVTAPPEPAEEPVDRQAAMLAAQERARGLGLEGQTSTNDLLVAEGRRRAEQAEKEAAQKESRRAKELEAQKKVEQKEIESTVYSTNPLVNERRKQDALTEWQSKWDKILSSVRVEPEGPVAYSNILPQKEKFPVDKEQLSDEKQELASLKDQEKSIRSQIFNAKKGGLNLRRTLNKALSRSELSEFGDPKNAADMKLISKLGGASLSDLVADGLLDDFLPPNLRRGTDASAQENADQALSNELDATEYIRTKLRNNDNLSFDASNAVRELGFKHDQISKQIEKYLTTDEINDLISEAIDEQRTADQNVEVAPAKSTKGVAGRSEAQDGREEVKDFDFLDSEDLKSSSKEATYQPDPEEQRIQDELQGKNLLQVSQWAVDNAPNAFVRVIAEKVQRRLREMQRRGVQFGFKIHTGPGREKRMRDCLGVTRLEWGKSPGGAGTKIAIELNGVPYKENQRGYPPGVNYSTILHELLHAATRAQLKFLGKNDPMVLQLKDLFAKVKEQVKKDEEAGTLPEVISEFVEGRNNALDNIDEMVSWGLTDSRMQEYLDNIEVGKKSAFTRLIELVREVMGIGKPYETALERLARTTEDILDVNIRELEGGITSVGVSYGPGKKRKTTMTGDVLMQENLPSAISSAKAAVQKALQPKPTKNVVGLKQDIQAGLDKVFGPHKKETIIDRIDGMRDRFWQRMAQGIADQYRTIKEYSEEAYIMARLSKTIDGSLEGLMFHGEVFNDDGALNIKPKSKGLFEVLKPLGNEVENYMRWVALSREAQLVAKKRLSSIDPEWVARRDELIEGEINGKPRKEVYEDVRAEMNKLNRSVLKVALDSGLIDSTENMIARLEEQIEGVKNDGKLSNAKRESKIQELESKIEALRKEPVGYESFVADINYIPFYKVMEDGDLAGAKTASGLARQEFSKMLKGGEKPFGDLMENTLRNWSHILSAAMKNQAANASLEAAQKVNAAVVSDSSEDGTVKVMKDGQAVYYKVTDPLLMEAITSIGYMGPKSKFLDVARDFKNMLQFGVTVSPAFKIRNLIRDSVSAMAISDLKKNPVANVIEGINLTDKNNPYYMSALAGGAVFNFGSAYEGDQAKMIRRLLDMGVKDGEILDSPEKIKRALSTAWGKYQELGNKSEAANRMALYKQMRDKGMSHLEATFYARDLLDFSMQGSFPAFRFLTQVVPFLNARVQGLYKLGRDGINPTVRVIYNTATGKPIEGSDKVRAQSFSIVSAAVGLASMALYAAFKDDEEFKKRDDWDRDNFWWFRLPGMDYAFRIPKPFEIGAFGTLIERTMDQIYDEGAEGKDFVKALERMATDTFAFNLPQVIKPMVDIYANRDSFTGSPIESAGMERLSKAERMTDNTSPLAIALGGLSNIFLPEKMELSPVQVDYLIKGYFGWMGAQASWVSHYAVMPFQEGTKPDNKWTDTVSAGFVRSLPATQSRYVNAFYENAKEISQAYADMRHYAELGDSAKVEQLIQEKGDKIAMAKFYDKTSKDLSEIRKAIQAITADKTMDGATKREEVDRLKILLGELAEQAETARKSMKK